MASYDGRNWKLILGYWDPSVRLFSTKSCKIGSDIYLLVLLLTILQVNYQQQQQEQGE